MAARCDAAPRVLLALGIALPACSDCLKLPPAPGSADPEGPPRLLAGHFINASVVELSFSEPLAPVDGVDPAKFRLSMARPDPFRSYGRCEGDTYYCELSDGLSEFRCGQCEGFSTDEGCSERTAVTELSLDEDDQARLLLTIEPPLDPFRCLQLQYAPAGTSILVHFSKLDIPTIADASGQTLEDIAPHWVLSGERDTVGNGLMAARSALVPIACPEDF